MDGRVGRPTIHHLEGPLAAWFRSAPRNARLAELEALLERQAALDAARIRFFANVVHELRTPLNVVLGQIDAALGEPDAATRERQLRVASRNARRLQRLADQALELTRLDAGGLAADRQTIEVVGFLESLVLSFGELAERKGILLEFIARPRTVVTEVDPHQLTTIVTNLLSNALKYTPGGGRIGVAVEVRAAAPEQASGDRLWVTVADTGPGIAPDRHEEIFRPFVRGAEADRLDPAGAGIGLALARELARIHAGTIRVEGEPGRGTRFIVDLPLGARGALATAEPLLPTDGGRPPITEEILHRTTGVGDIDAGGATSSGPVILVADDHADLRDWMAQELGALARVETVGDGAGALVRAGEVLPDLIVADVRMPGLDGRALCRRLRSDERTSHIPVVLLSAAATTDDRVAASEAGADGFLAKPVEGRELLAMVSALLATRQTLRERFRTQVVLKPSEISPRSVDQLFLEKVTTTIEEHFDDSDFSVGELASEMAMSVSQLSRKLAALIDQTPGQLMRAMRLERAATLVAAGAGNLSEIAYLVGFADQAHFSRSFKKYFGVTPSEYRRAEQGGLPATS